MVKTAEMTFAEALSSVDSKQEKLASAFRDMPLEELEGFLKKEAFIPPKVPPGTKFLPSFKKKEKKSEMEKLSASEKFLLADQWGRELAHKAKTAAEQSDEYKSLSKGHGRVGAALGAAAGAARIGTASSFGKLDPRVKGLAMLGGAAFGAGAGYLGGRAKHWAAGKVAPKSKEKKSGGVEMISKQSSITLTAGVTGMLSKIAPTITKGLAGAGKAMAGSTSKGRAMVGGAIGAAGGALKDPGVDPVTGQRKSRLTGALAGAGLGAAAGHYAPQAVGGAQKLMGKLTPGA